MKKKLIWLIPIIAALLVYLLFQTVLLIGYVPTASMEPTLEEGSYILGLRPYGKLKTGDIVIFKHEEGLLVKRIAASGGESITVEGIRYIVPEGHYLMLGDNAENSYDSRYWEVPYVSEEAIVAKLIRPSNYPY